MTTAVIVDAVRTAGGKRNGKLRNWHAVDLASEALKALQERNKLDPSLVDDVIMGCVMQVSEQSLNIGRNAVLAAGWPESVPATTVDRQCGSSQQAVHFAAAGVVSGQYDVAVAGGVESMSRVPMGSSTGQAWPFGEAFRARYAGTCPVPSWTNTASPRTRRPPPRRTRAGTTIRSCRSPRPTAR
jgi:acetyl-CoA acetyltransferase